MKQFKSIDTNLPLVTAVLICWNHERFVRDAILSALEQSYNNIQLIVFDNSSTDNSAKIIQQLADDHHFSFVRQENIGIIRTLNRGLQMAKGEYFTMLATDDIWFKDKIQRQVEYLETNKNFDMISGHVTCIDGQGQIIDWLQSTSSGVVTFAKLMRNEITVNGPTVMARTQALREAGCYDESVRIEDFSMALKFAYQGKQIMHTGEMYTYYRRHGNNWSVTPLYDEMRKIGQIYRHTPEYIDFVNYALRGYFRWLADHRKMDAIKFLITEPVKWSYFEVGAGLVKLLCPSILLRFYRKKYSKPASKFKDVEKCGIS